MPHGRLLIDYAEAIVRADDDLARLRADLVDRVGAEAAAHAAATVSAFSGLVRVADGTGIPIDDGLAAASVDLRGQLGLDSFGGASNSPKAQRHPDPLFDPAITSVDSLFDNRNGAKE